MMLGIVTGGIYQEHPQPLSINAENIFSEFQGLGAKWIRIEANWSNVNPLTYQNIVRKAHSKGLKVIVLVAATFTGNDIDEFTKQYVTNSDSTLNKLVNEVFYGDARADALEITNEPNQTEKTATGYRISGNAFAYLLRRVQQWKTTHNRPELIISGGIINTYYDKEQWWTDFFSSGAWREGPRPFDYMGVHPYNAFSIDQNAVNRLDPNCFAPWKNTTKTLLSGLAAKMNQLTGTTNTQLMVTEFGWQMPIGAQCELNQNCVTTLEQAAAGMQAAVEAFNDSGVVFAALWYDYRNDNDWNTNTVLSRFGLRQRWNGTQYAAKLPVWLKFKALAGGTGSNDPESYWH